MAAEKGIEFLTHFEVIAIEKGKVHGKTLFGERTLDSDTIVSAAGWVSQEMPRLRATLEEKGIPVFVIGSATEPGRLFEATQTKDLAHSRTPLLRGGVQFDNHILLNPWMRVQGTKGLLDTLVLGYFLSDLVMSKRPIGVFDSGMGGLSVLRHIRRSLPAEDLVYVADSAYFPYGSKPRSQVLKRAVTIAQFLVSLDIKAIVVACNTATAAAISTLRESYAIPIVGVEPGIKPGASVSKTGILGVLATEGTLESEKFRGLREKFDKEVQILVQPCPGLVDQVEKGDLTSDETRKLLRAYVTPLLRSGVDTIILGCTHYPFLLPLIQELVEKEIFFVDTGEPVSKELQRRLEASGLLSHDTGQGRDTFYSTSGRTTQNVITRLWGTEMEVFEVPDWVAIQ